MNLRRSERRGEARIDEARRQNAIDELRLDTFSDPNIDAVVDFARRAFQADAAVFSVIDGDRQWNKSRSGTDVFEIPRTDSFCDHTILEDGALVVPDATRDIRFANNPAVIADPSVRFYAGYPVETVTGERIGAVCVFGTEPRSRNSVDIVMLRELALMVQERVARLAA